MIKWLGAAVFGLGAVSKQVAEEQTKVLAAHRHGLSSCARCHSLLDAKAGRSFILHLQDYHKIEANESYEVIADVYRRMAEYGDKKDSI